MDLEKTIETVAWLMENHFTKNEKGFRLYEGSLVWKNEIDITHIRTSTITDYTTENEEEKEVVVCCVNLKIFRCDCDGEERTRTYSSTWELFDIEHLKEIINNQK